MTHMSENRHLFNEYYNQPINHIKWFEPFVDPIILEEFKNDSIHEGMSLLDIGAGCSLDSIFFAYNGFNVTSVDFAQNALDKLRDLAGLIGVSIKLIHTSVLDLPEEIVAQFDIASDNGCFHHIDPSKRRAYAESLSRVLKPGGVLYIRAHSSQGQNPPPGPLRAHRLSSDVIIDTFSQHFIISDMFHYNYFKTGNGSKRVWFIKMINR